MKKESRFRWVLRAVSRYFTFFALVAFAISCCMMLFVTLLTRELNVTLTSETLAPAAKLTFWNVILISAIFTLMDGLRRRLTVERHVKEIAAATEKMIAGDFSVRIKPIPRFAADESFNKIILCINKIAEELSGVETLRTDFIANVSHELKTPLAVMGNYATLLKSPNLTEKERLEYAIAISDASRRLSSMVSNILKLNRLENQTIYPKTETYDLGEQLCECLLRYESVWEKKEIEIETEIADGVMISADRELLSHVWSNLFSNAFKFTEDGGRVTLTLHTEGAYAVVRISDTGCGMSPEVGAHIFEKFYQGDSSRATEGNGLGLALVRRVVDIMQGEIGVESTVGVGTTFTVKIRRESNVLEAVR